MAYVKNTWVNGRAGNTPINATRLNHMESGIEDADITNPESAATAELDDRLGDYVAKTGNETIAGVKTHTDSPIVPTPTTDFQVATKKYVDDNAGGGGGGGEGTVVSVNTIEPDEDGDITLDADDIPSGTLAKQFTNALKDKLDAIAAGAEVNVNADWNSGSGDSQILNKPDLNLKANVASPALTGTPTAPTASAGTSTTQLATTNFVGTALANILIDEDSFATNSASRLPSQQSVKAYVDTIAASVTASIDALAAKVGGIQVAKWTGVAWKVWDGTGWTGTVSTSTAIIRIYISLNVSDASAPTYYNTDDMWFAHPLQAGV